MQLACDKIASKSATKITKKITCVNWPLIESKGSSKCDMGGQNTWLLTMYLFVIDPTNIAKEFSTGYLLGELLNKHGLQEDFSFFSQNM